MFLQIKLKHKGCTKINGRIHVLHIFANPRQRRRHKTRAALALPKETEYEESFFFQGNLFVSFNFRSVLNETSFLFA